MIRLLLLLALFIIVHAVPAHSADVASDWSALGATTNPAALWTSLTTSTTTTTTVPASANSTTTSVTGSVSSLYGVPVTFAALVIGNGDTVPTGTVIFKDGTAALGTGTLSNGVATYTTSALRLSVGVHSITAVYGGDTFYNGSTSPVLTQTVTSSTPTTTTNVTSSSSTSVYGTTVTFTATVIGSGPTIPTGTVIFKDGTTTLGTGALGGTTGDTATYTTSAQRLSVGTHSITAVYSGDTYYNGSTSPTLTQTVTTSNDFNGNYSGTTTSYTTSGIQYTFSLSIQTVSGSTFGGSALISNGSQSAISFLTGTVTSTRNASVALNYTTSAGAVCAYSGNAVNYGTYLDINIILTSSTISTTTAGGSSLSCIAGSLSGRLTKVTTSTATSITSSSSTSVYGTAVTFTARVTTSGTTTPTGTVTFMDGTTTLGTQNLSNSAASYTTSALIAGPHSITAVYGGDFFYSGSTSPTLTQTITPATSSGAGDNYSGTYTTPGLTINLSQSSSALSGTFSKGNLNGNLGGFVDSSGRAQVWAWWDSSISGSGAIAGNLSKFGNQGTFSFGGGQSSSGRIGNIVLSDMAQGSLSGSTTTSTGPGAANYAGTYTTAGVTIVLAQYSSTLSGIFSSGGNTGSIGGFVDSNGHAYVWTWWDSPTSGSGVLAGNLAVSPTQGTFSFGGGQSSRGNIGNIVLSGMTRQ